MAKKKHPEHVNHERWLVSYADFITLLFAFFVVMFAVSQVDTKKMGRFSESFSRAVGESFLMDGGRSLLREGGQPPPEPAGNGDVRLPKELEKLAKALAERREDLSGLKVLRRRNELVIRLADSVLFDSGDDTVKEPAVRVLAVISNELRDRKVDVRVEGHTDDVPIHTVRFHSNWDLSAARATAVIEQLAGPGRIAPVRLSASGYGEFHPVAPNVTAEGRAQNRRVDLVVAAAVEEPVEDRPYTKTTEEPDAPKTGAPETGQAPSGKAVMGPPLPPEMGGDSTPGEPAGPPGAPAAPHEEPSASARPEAPASGRPSTSVSPAPSHSDVPAPPRREAPHSRPAQKAPAKPAPTPSTPPPEEPIDFPLRH